MSIIEVIKQCYRKNTFTYFLFYPVRLLYNTFFFYIIPDKMAIEWKFYKLMGYRLNWNNLQTFSEKLQWLKLYDRKPWYSDCVDKFKVRGYITRKLGTDKYLVPLYYETSDWRDIKQENIPDTPVVIKCNHDNSSCRIIYNKADVNWKEIRLYYRRRINGRSHFYSNREWPYKHIQPRIMIEELLIPKGNEGLMEYKFYCFEGKIRFIQLSIIDKEGKKYRYLNSDYIPYSTGYHIGEMQMIQNMPEINCKEDMKKIALCLAEDFKYHIRVDIYQVDRKLYVGELTFFDGAGFDIIYPLEWNKEIGSFIHLPIQQ